MNTTLSNAMIARVEELSKVYREKMIKSQNPMSGDTKEALLKRLAWHIHTEPLWKAISQVAAENAPSMKDIVEEAHKNGYMSIEGGNFIKVGGTMRVHINIGEERSKEIQSLEVALQKHFDVYYEEAYDYEITIHRKSVHRKPTSGPRPQVHFHMYGGEYKMVDVPQELVDKLVALCPEHCYIPCDIISSEMY